MQLVTGHPVPAVSSGLNPLNRPCKAVLLSGPRQTVLRRATINRGLEADKTGIFAASADEQTLEQLTLLRRQLEQAVADENYGLAKKLKQQTDSIKEQLPPVQQYMLGQLERLRTGTTSEQQAALRAIAEVGDDSCTAELAACLKVPELHDQAEETLWALWHKHPNPEVKALLNQGLTLLRDSSRLQPALDVFDAACRMEPSWAEAHNKRATVLYLMHKYEDSIEVCKLVLDLNPYHFGAFSGMGLCYLELQDFKSALRAFEQAIAVNPEMKSCHNYVTAIRAKLADDSGR